jgi:hypothetical protein
MDYSAMRTFHFNIILPLFDDMFTKIFENSSYKKLAAALLWNKAICFQRRAKNKSRPAIGWTAFVFICYALLAECKFR